MIARDQKTSSLGCWLCGITPPFCALYGANHRDARLGSAAGTFEIWHEAGKLDEIRPSQKPSHIAAFISTAEKAQIQ